VYVSEYPAIQHLHPDNEVVTVRLKRRDGELKAFCADCDTEFVYRKPKKSSIQHYKVAASARGEGELRLG
jgi:hypothetical protein